MKRLLTLSLLAALALPVHAARADGHMTQDQQAGSSDSAAAPAATPSAADPSGRWSGAIKLPNGELAIDVTLSSGSDSGDGAGWTGSIDIRAQGLHGFPLSAVGVDGGRVHFEMSGVPGTPTFDGTLDEAGSSIAGTFHQGGQSLEFSLHRASGKEEPAKSAAAADAVPGTGMVGEWKGALDVGVTLRLALHVKSAEGGGLTAVFDSLDQGATLPVDTITFEGGTLRFAIDQIKGSYEGSMNDDGSAVEGTWSQGGRSIPLTFYRTAEAFALERPQTPKAPFPYDSRDVTFPNEAAGIELAGTVLTPAGAGPFPAVVFITGSGAQDRDEALMGHRPFLVIADALARRGIASLRYDDRGAGASGGDHMGSTVGDFAGDAAAALAFLATQPKIDPKAIGILGHSEGGLTGPKLAAESSAVDFLVLLAPPGEPLRSLLMRQGRDIMTQKGIDPALIDQAMAAQEKNLALIADPSIPSDDLAKQLRQRADARRASFSEQERAALGLDDGTIDQSIQIGISAWFRSLMRENPAVYLRTIKVPVLALFGTKDIQVDADVNSQALRTALQEAGDQDVSIRIMPGLNHLFQHAGTGAVEEYGQIEETISPEVLTIIGDWIEARFPRGGDVGR